MKKGTLILKLALGAIGAVATLASQVVGNGKDDDTKKD